MIARDRLIVALDFPTVVQARRLIDNLGDTVNFYKIGMELVYGDDGLVLARELIAQGKDVFIDLKLLDIPNTVEKSTARIASIGAKFLTVHAYPSAMEAAMQGSQGSNLKILGVTVLTSFDNRELNRSGYDYTVRDLVAQRAKQARDCGVQGIVCSAFEVSFLKNTNDSNLIFVSPGIRSQGYPMDDQKRAATVGTAIQVGVDYIVVGRPITKSPNPKLVATEIIAEIENAA